MEIVVTKIPTERHRIVSKTVREDPEKTVRTANIMIRTTLLWHT